MPDAAILQAEVDAWNRYLGNNSVTLQKLRKQYIDSRPTWLQLPPDRLQAIIDQDKGTIEQFRDSPVPSYRKDYAIAMTRASLFKCRIREWNSVPETRVSVERTGHISSACMPDNGGLNAVLDAQHHYALHGPFGKPTGTRLFTLDDVRQRFTALQENWLHQSASSTDLDRTYNQTMNPSIEDRISNPDPWQHYEGVFAKYEKAMANCRAQELRRAGH
jgi:hypothetical protein